MRSPDLKSLIYSSFPVICLLITLHILFLLQASKEKSLTFDEPAHIVGGYNALINRDFKMTLDNGILSQCLVAAPLVPLTLKAPPLLPMKTAMRDWYAIQKDFLFSNSSPAQRIIFLSRLMIIISSAVLAILVFLFSKELFGTKGGLVSLAVYALSPTILANSALANSDIVCAGFFLLSTWSVWKVLQKVTIERILLSSVSIAFLCVSKMSFIIFLPVYLSMIFIRIKCGPELILKIASYEEKTKKQSKMLKFIFLILVVNLIFILFTVWAFHDFSYQIINKSQQNDTQLESLTSSTGNVGKAINFLAKKRILPESFLYGFLSVYHNSQRRYSFMNGEFSINGFFLFFPYSFLIKTPVPILFLICVSFFILLSGYARNKLTSPCKRCNLIYNSSPFIILIIIYFLFAISARINIGHRHILPVYPPLFVLCGACSLCFRKQHQYGGGILRISILILLSWLFVETLSIQPDFLAYFNQIAGGPKNGYKRLLDSSLDWGQDLSGLPGFIKKNKIKQKNTYLSYFGVDIPERFGIKCNVLPGHMLSDEGMSLEIGEGTYFISATMLQLIYMPDILYSRTGMKMSELNEDLYASLKNKFQGKTPEINRNNKEYELYKILSFIKLCLYAKNIKPDAQIGHSILVYDFSETDIDKALQYSQ